MTETITADVVETPVAEAPAAEPQAPRKFRLNWQEHTRPFEAPTYTCRITHGRQLQISLMSFLEHKLRDRPAGVSADYGGDDTVYVHLCSFGRMPHMGGMWERRGPDDKDHLGWLAFETVTVFKNGQAPLDPEDGPLTTEAERTAAVHRSYPVAVEKLMTYCDGLFDPYDGTPPVVTPATTAGDKPSDSDLWRGYHNLMRNPSVGKVKITADDVDRAAAGPVSPEEVDALRGVIAKALGDGWEQMHIGDGTFGEQLATDPAKLVDVMCKDLLKGERGVLSGKLKKSKFAEEVAATMDPADLLGAKLFDALEELDDVDLAAAVQTTTVITVPAEPDAITVPFTGLNRRDAAEKAIDAAKHAGTMVTLEHDGETIGVHGTDTVDDVADRLLHPVDEDDELDDPEATQVVDGPVEIVEREEDVNDSFSGPNGG